MVGAVLAGQQLFYGGDEFVSHGAADAAIGQFDDVILGAIFVAAGFQNIAVHTHITEFVDDEGKFSFACIGQNMAHQCGLAGA